MAHVEVSASFWAGKRVFLTGHTGFKGSWMSLWLQRLGSSVVGYSLAPPSEPSLFEVARVAEGMVSLRGDVRDLPMLAAAMAEHRPEVVIHMAAQALVRDSYERPVETYETNVMGTVNVLEAVRSTPSVKAAVIVTSDKCYENREWDWAYRENEPMGGRDPYSSSKGCAELVVAAYRQSFFAKAGRSAAVASVRAGNVIGGGDWAKDRLIPDIVRAVGEGRAIAVRNPAAVRPWQHVLEPLAGYLLLAEKLCKEPAAFSAGWNFGPDETEVRPVSWIVQRIVEEWGGGARWERQPGEHPHEAGVLKVDSSRARSGLQWSSQLRLAEALSWIVEWYKAYLRHDDMRASTEAQIARYQAASRNFD